MRKAIKVAIGLIVLAGVGIQFVPAHRTNRIGAGDPDAPREVMYVLRRACYDCHSTESRWPIWAYVAPMSWQVIGDVEQARRAMNFSDWALMDATRRYVARAQVAAVVKGHRMPAWYYLTLHPDARLSDQDREVLTHWGTSAAPPAPTGTP
jgi:heme-binding protein